MEQIINFQLKLNKKLAEIETEIKDGKEPPTLLLHGCCAPCSSYVIEYLNRYFDITSFYYNPNISDEDEYNKRVEELKRLIVEMPVTNEVSFIEGRYDTSEYDKAILGLEELGEKSKRCYACYELRIEETAKVAAEKKYDYFTTTLSISPHKNATWINEIGERVGKKYGVEYLFADFKKNNGYKRSIELSKEYDLYRQDFCGCRYSREERMRSK